MSQDPTTPIRLSGTNAYGEPKVRMAELVCGSPEDATATAPVFPNTKPTIELPAWVRKETEFFHGVPSETELLHGDAEKYHLPSSDKSHPIALPQLKSSRVWGIGYHVVDMQEALLFLEAWVRRRIPGYAITSNLNYSMLCRKESRLSKFTERAALVLCDGMPILWRSLVNTQKLPERVAGSDLIYRLAELCQTNGFRLYLYGAAPGIAEKAAEVLLSEYPKLQIAGVQCPPFRATSSAEIQASLQKIKAAKPDVLLVALGQPKGEYWIEDHYKELGVPISIQVGASFDFVAGKAKRAPVLFQKMGLEWLYRACHDPRRLLPRYTKNLLYLVRVIRRDLIDLLA
ncbi:MAG: WecB/TagA/CpsF family glycosyltransferase [Planctomycetes bacterium]|nr:WecB/TagA/CpsF family glycosyltransferase [Planctomycetota bacterium]